MTKKSIISEEKKKEIKEKAGKIASEILTDLEPIIKKYNNKLFDSLKEILDKKISSNIDKGKESLGGQDGTKEKS